MYRFFFISDEIDIWPFKPVKLLRGPMALFVPIHSEESLFIQTSVAIVIGFLAEMDGIPCCGRPESSSSNI